jgi:hypothetical protein
VAAEVVVAVAACGLGDEPGLAGAGIELDHRAADAFADVGPALDRLVETGRSDARADEVALGR